MLDLIIELSEHLLVLQESRFIGRSLGSETDCLIPEHLKVLLDVLFVFIDSISEGGELVPVSLNLFCVTA